MGKIRYLSTLQYVSAVIGNSSSGIIEVPSFGIPSLNIGDRQKGRIAADSVIYCGTSMNEIKRGIELVLSKKVQQASAKTVNPYQKEKTTSNILNVLKVFPLDNLIQKSFYNIKYD
jgi:UDP-N-acetylglucosamine 2-epimerase (non-hydrolysing)/GDP/UDP-N,N'-diacetylbacillosamine 2-epimerase (hydrolysing)